jgi:hypothetical protein
VRSWFDLCEEWLTSVTLSTRESEAMSEKPIFAILAIAVALASVAEATTLDRNSAARAKSKTLAAATPLKKADSVEDRLFRKL